MRDSMGVTMPCAADSTEEFEAFLLVAADAGDSDEYTDEAREAGDGELLDADRHFSVGVVGIDS